MRKGADNRSHWEKTENDRWVFGIWDFLRTFVLYCGIVWIDVIL